LTWKFYKKIIHHHFVKGELRVGKNMEPSPDSNAFGKVAMMMHWFHVDCFVEKR
jgi:hypothetical protein